MEDKMTITFWGVRGSYPVTGSQAAFFGGNTACVSVQAGDQLIILDAGTGIIPLGKDCLRRGQPVRAALFFSHLHHDHTQGFPFFTPFFLPRSSFHLFGPDLYARKLEDVLDGVISPPVFPLRVNQMQARLAFHNLIEGSTVWLGPQENPQVFAPGDCPAAPQRPADTVEVRLLHSYAHPGGVMLYRINWRDRSLVYATDTEGYVNGDRRLASFARGADILIHDAQYTQEHYCGLRKGQPATQGWGHSTVQMACELAAAAEVRQLVLFHHDPGYDDEQVLANETLARTLFVHSLAAREGLQLEAGHVTRHSIESSRVQYRYHKPGGQPPSAPFNTGSS